MYNLVYKCLLSNFRHFSMWITLFLNRFRIVRYNVRFLFFVQFAHEVKVNGTFCLFVIFRKIAQLVIQQERPTYASCHANMNESICESSTHFILENSSDCKNLFIICSGNNNSRLGSGCMNNLSISDVHSNMTGIANQIARLCICKTIYSRTLAAVCG